MTDPGSSENTKQDKHQKPTKQTKRNLGILYSNCRKAKIKEKRKKEKKTWKKPEGEKALPIKEIRIKFDFSSETMQPRRKWYEIFKVLRGKKI